MTGFRLSATAHAKYFALLRSYSSQISQALDQQTAKDLFHIMHKIKGSALLYGHERLSDLGKGIMKLEGNYVSEEAKRMSEEVLKEIETIASAEMTS